MRDRDSSTTNLKVIRLLHHLPSKNIGLYAQLSTFGFAIKNENGVRLDTIIGLLV